MNGPPRTHVREVSQVETELAALWRGSSKETAPVRARTHNLVVACADAAGELEAATRLVGRITEAEPGRALVVVPASADGEPGSLEVYLSTHCHRGPGGVDVGSEQVTLETRDMGNALVPATILQLLMGDMPVYTLWRRPGLEDDPLFAPLCKLSDRLIVDCAAAPDPARQLAALGRFRAAGGWKGRLDDLSWVRDEPWREALASFFDARALAPCLERIVRLAVTARGEGGAAPAGAYCAGWLASRLGWTPAAAGSWTRRDGGRVALELGHEAGSLTGELVAVKIDAELDGEPIAFAAARVASTTGHVELATVRQGTCPPPQRIKLPSRDEAALVCGTLQRKARDRVFESALGAAARMA